MKGARSETSKGIVRARDHEQRALELRKTGATYEQIGKQIGLTSGGAKKALIRAIAKAGAVSAETAAQVRTLELERLDAMLLGLWTNAKSGDVSAIDRVLKIQDRRSRYLGLDAPTRTEVTGQDGAPLLTWVDVVLRAEREEE